MIKKKVTRSMISLLISVFAVFSSIPLAHAATNSGAGTVQKSSTTYGTYSWVYSKSGMLGYTFANDSNFSTLAVDIDLKNYYSGNITITISGVTNFANVGILVTGGYIAQQSTNQVKVQIVYSNKIHVEFYSTTAYTSTSYNWSCSVGVGTLNLIDDSEASSLDDIAAAVTSNTYGLQAIYNDLESIEDALGTLSSINNYLAQSLAVEKMQLYPVWQHSAIFWGSSMGTLMYDNDMPYFDYLAADNSSSYTASKRLCVAPKSTYSLYIYTINQLGANSWNIYMRGSDPAINSTRSYSYTPPSTSYFMYRFDFTNNSSSHVYFEIEFNVNVTIFPLFYGNKMNVPDDIHYLFGDDFNNTYTRLLQQMINAIGTISQTQITENNTNINNYNNYQTQINNVENNYYNQYNTYETNIENNNTFDFTGLDSNGVTAYHNLFTSVYNISLIRWPILIILLGLVIVIILG